MKILRDTREQKGWNFAEAQERKLDTGDYTLEGLEEILCIERKGCVGELAGNLTDKRFDREIERMLTYKYRYIVCEFDLKDVVVYPYNMPPNVRKQIKITGAFLLKRINEIGLDVNFIFAGKYGQEYTLSLMKRIWEKHSK